MMIDKLQLQLQFYHNPIGEDYYLRLSKDTIVHEVRAKLWVKGSYDATVYVRSADLDSSGMAHSIVINGNPIKWFQGHNLFGSSDTLHLAQAFVFDVIEKLGLRLNEQEVARIFAGNFKVKKIHLTKCYLMESEQQVTAWITEAADRSTSRYKVKTSYKNGSLYFGQKARRCTIKIYAKGPEVRAHQLPPRIQHREALIDHAKQLLRVEVELTHMELERLSLNHGHQWQASTPEKVFTDKLKAISIPANMPVPHQDFLDLPVTYRGTYLAWREGLPMDSYFKTRQTYHNHRKALLVYGIDIAVKPRTGDEATVIPIWDEARLVEASIPLWAMGTPLFFTPEQQPATLAA